MSENAGDLPSSWEARLSAAEADLRERQRQALEGEPTPAELRALAEENEKLAADRDAVADAYDEEARRRDGEGLERDVRASGRDRASRDYTEDTGWAGLDRISSGRDRDSAAIDRADSRDDRTRSSQARRRAATDRQRAADDRDAAQQCEADLEHEIEDLREALKTRLVIGQAEGLLMARHHVGSDAAFRLLVALSQRAHRKLRDVSAHLVADHDRASDTTGEAAD